MGHGRLARAKRCVSAGAGWNGGCCGCPPRPVHFEAYVAADAKKDLL